MNNIKKMPVNQLGYGFIKEQNLALKAISSNIAAIKESLRSK